MRDHSTAYKNKLISIEEAVGKIESDTDIVVAQCASEPQGLMEKFHLAAPRVKSVKVFSVLTLKPYEFFMDPEMQGHFELCSWFHSEGARRAIQENTGIVDFVPNMLRGSFRPFRKVLRSPSTGPTPTASSPSSGSPGSGGGA